MDANLTVYDDRSIVADNTGNEWLSLDERVTWSDRHGHWEINSGNSVQEIADDAKADGLSIEFEKRQTRYGR